jgi:hypothetical protein
LLIAGAVVTLLFLIFPEPVFELGYYEREFSNEMYNEHLYLIVAVVTAWWPGVPPAYSTMWSTA